MKFSSTLALALPLLLSACGPGKGAATTSVAEIKPRFEELATEVPRGFSDSKKWNLPHLCPEGSRLTPFTKYDYDPGQKNHGFKYYFGRSCAIIQSELPETVGRKLASTEAPRNEAVTLIPHGPYIWWYETGKRMETGVFERGTLSLGSSRYEPDGTISAKD